MNECEKLILAESDNVRLIYCKQCNVVEMHIGATSIRLTTEYMQHLANLMMKSSLKLDRMFTHGIATQPDLPTMQLH